MLGYRQADEISAIRDPRVLHWLGVLVTNTMTMRPFRVGHCITQEISGRGAVRCAQGAVFDYGEMIRVRTKVCGWFVARKGWTGWLSP